MENQAALMSRRIRAIEHRKCAAGLAGAHRGLQDRIFLNYTGIWECAYGRQEIFRFFCYV